MSTQLYLQCFGIGSLGILFKLIWSALMVDKKLRLANQRINFKDYIKDDALGILASFVALFIFLVMISEYLNWQPWIINYIKSIFVFVGFGAGDLLIRLLGAYSNRANKILANFENDKRDEKNN
jgi:hypothetical protein